MAQPAPPAQPAPQDYSLFDLVFKSLEAMLSSLTTGTTAIAEKIIELGTSYQVLLILFGIQASWLAVRLVIEEDGFDVVTSFVRQIALYATIFLALNSWSGLGFGLVNFANGWMTGAVVNASSSLVGGKGISSNIDNPVQAPTAVQALSSNIDNPVQALTAVQTLFSDKYKSIREEFKRRKNQIAKEMSDKAEKGSVWDGLSNIGDKTVAFFAVFFTNILLDIANIILWATMGFLVLYMFVGWMKALFGAAFGPFALYLLPLDRGRLLGTAVSFILGGVGIYAFSLVIVMLAMNMWVTGAELVMKQTGPTEAYMATRDVAFALGIVVLSILMLMVANLSKDWGAEFFGIASFDVSMPRGTGYRRNRKDRRDHGGGGGANSGSGGNNSGGGRAAGGGGGGGGGGGSGGGTKIGGGGSPPALPGRQGTPTLLAPGPDGVLTPRH